MENTNFIKISNSRVEITVAERVSSNLTQPELATEAMLSLISYLDVKQFDTAGVREKFDTCLESIAKSVHAIGERGGWQDH